MQLNLALRLSSQDKAELIVTRTFLIDVRPQYRLTVQKGDVGDEHRFAVQRVVQVGDTQGWSEPYHTSEGTFVEICALLVDLGSEMDQWQPVEEA